MSELLSDKEKGILLKLARMSLQAAVQGEKLPALDLKKMPEILQKKGSSFVTLTYKGELRGCIGSLEPYLPLAEDVREHAIAAAMQDYRFPPVRTEELDDIRIEISRLTLPTELEYRDSDDLMKRLRPGVDGVILRDGAHRATFLPQVWEKLPDPAVFLGYLCQKMGATADLWRWKKIQVLIYQVEEFHE